MLPTLLLRTPLLRSLILTTVLLSVTACSSNTSESNETKTAERPTVTLMDRQLSLAPKSLETLSFELRPNMEVRVEAVHVSGEPVALMFMDKDAIASFRADQHISLYYALSKSNLTGKFDSDWHPLPSAVYTVLAVRQGDKDKTEPSVVNVRVYSR